MVLVIFVPELNEPFQKAMLKIEIQGQTNVKYS